MDENQKKLSILMLPLVAHGHVYPFFELAKRLSARNFHIYFCSTPVTLDLIRAEEAPPPSIEPVELHLPSSPQLPPHMHTTKNLPPHLMPQLAKAFQESRTNFARILDDKKPDLVIYDFFQPWAAKFAGSRGIPAVFLGILGATPYSYYHHQYTTAKEGSTGGRYTFPSEAVYVLDHENFKDDGTLDELLGDDGDGDVEDDGFLGNFARSTEIVLMKSCRELEGKYANYLSTLCKKEVVTTGPLYKHYSSSEEEDDDDDEILKWLSGKNKGSTLYISFGSEHFLSEREIREIAKGLELCGGGVNFIWVIRFEPNEHGVASSSLEKALPQRFLEETKERGRIITGWAPQQKILAHGSVGGFLSHCGTNAITEAMVFGVPVIAVPVKFEQPITARLLVEAGFAVEVGGKPSEGNVVYTDYAGEEIAKGIKKVFVEKENGGVLRKRAKELGEKVKEGEEDEVSYLAERLAKLCNEYKLREHH